MIPRALAVIVALLVAEPATACHHFRYWHFRHPQRCAVHARRVMMAERTPAREERERPPTPPPAPRRSPPSTAPAAPPPEEGHEHARGLEPAPARDPAIEQLIKAMAK